MTCKCPHKGLAITKPGTIGVGVHEFQEARAVHLKYAHSKWVCIETEWAAWRHSKDDCAAHILQISFVCGYTCICIILCTNKTHAFIHVCRTLAFLHGTHNYYLRPIMF